MENERGHYGKQVWAAPVELHDVTAGAGMWLGFFAFIGWSLGRSLSTGINQSIEQLRKPKLG